MTSKPLTTTDQKDLLKELKKYLQKNNSIIEKALQSSKKIEKVF